MASIWRLNDQNFWVLSQNDESDQIIVHCIDLTSKRSKLLSYVPIRRKWSNYNGLHRFDIKTIQNVEIRRKIFKTTQTNESDQIIMHGIDLTIIWSLSSFCDKTQKFWSLRRQIDAMHYNLITFIGLRCFEYFATYLNILDCFDVKSMQSIVIWSLSSYRDVTQKFWSFRRQIDAMQYNLITFVVLRRNSNVLIVKTSNRCNSLCFDYFCSLITFVVLGRNSKVLIV